jgi:hypothetical protein
MYQYRRTDIENSYGSTYCYIPVCTALYLHGTMWYTEVHGGTGLGWCIAVQSTVHGGTWRYKTVQESFKSYRLVRTCTYLSLLINQVMLSRWILLLQFCPAKSSVLEITASIHTSASASKIQSIPGLAALAAGQARGPRRPPGPWRGASAEPLCQGPAVQGRLTGAQRGRQRARRRHRLRCCRRRRGVRFHSGALVKYASRIVCADALFCLRPYSIQRSAFPPTILQLPSQSARSASQ